MKTAVIESWAGFEDLEPEWNPLLVRSRANTVFLTWQWMKAWSEVVRDHLQPFIVVVRDAAGRLTGIAPFYRTEMRLVGMLSYRALRIMGDYATGGEYGDWIQEPEREGAVGQAMIQALQQHSAEWECLWMPNVSGRTGAKERIFDVCQGNGWFAHCRPMVFAGFSLPATWDAYLEMLAPKKRKEVRAQTKRFHHSPRSLAECTLLEDLPRYLDALFDLHSSRWSALGQAGVFHRKPREAAFYRAFTPRALQEGWLRLFALEDEGAMRAVQIGYAYAGVFHALQEGFDPNAEKGIGNVLRARIIERCIEEKLTDYDFLGTMSDHKRRWGAQERSGWDLLIGHRTWKNRLLFTRELWPTGRYFRPVARKG